MATNGHGHLAVPPLAGTFGQPGGGKTSDLLWAVGGGIVIAGPGKLIPAISTVGWEPSKEQVEILDPLTADLTILRKTMERRIKTWKGPKTVGVDDLSVVAHRTARLMGAKYKDGRQLYGKFREAAQEMFDEWRSYGWATIVNCHVQVPDYEVDKEGNTTSKLKEKGGPDLPGRKAAPDMLKEWDLFYRTDTDPLRAMGGLFGAPSVWPFVYKAGPWNGMSELWETKDRWNVVPSSGSVTMNLGEILRHITRKHGLGWNIARAPGMEWAEETVAWAANQIAAGVQEPTLITDLARQLLAKKVPAWQIGWLARDIRSRVELNKLGTDQATLAQFGIQV